MGETKSSNVYFMSMLERATEAGKFGHIISQIFLFALEKLKE